MNDEDFYVLEHEYLEQNIEKALEESANTDKVVAGILTGRLSDIVHDIVFAHPALSRKLLDELKYYEEMNVI